MDVITLIGRVLFVFLFFGSAFGHITQTEAMAGYASSKGVPSAKAATFGSGVLMAVAGSMLLLGVWADLGALLLVLFPVPTAFLMHNSWKETDPAGQAGGDDPVQQGPGPRGRRPHVLRAVRGRGLRTRPHPHRTAVLTTAGAAVTLKR